MIWDVWHTQLRIVSAHFPDAKLRVFNRTFQLPAGTHFVYVTPTVARREITVPHHVVQSMQMSGRIVIHVMEPRE